MSLITTKKGRSSLSSRRGFVRNSALATLGTALPLATSVAQEAPHLAVSVHYDVLNKDNLSATVTVTGPRIALICTGYAVSEQPGKENSTTVSMKVVNTKDPTMVYNRYKNVLSEYATTDDLVLDPGTWQVVATCVGKWSRNTWLRLSFSTETSVTVGS